MRSFPKHLASVILATFFSSTMLFTGCSARVSTGYTVHDGYYNDDHVWDDHEIVFYNRWEGETRRDHRDFRSRPANEQKEYFTWRHNQH